MFFFKDFCYQVLTKIIPNSWWFWSSEKNVSVGIAQDRFCQFCSEINTTTANHSSFGIFYGDLEYKIMKTLVKIIRLAQKLIWYQKTDTWITTSNFVEIGPNILSFFWNFHFFFNSLLQRYGQTRKAVVMFKLL